MYYLPDFIHLDALDLKLVHNSALINKYYVALHLD